MTDLANLQLQRLGHLTFGRDLTTRKRQEVLMRRQEVLMRRQEVLMRRQEVLTQKKVIAVESDL